MKMKSLRLCLAVCLTAMVFNCSKNSNQEPDNQSPPVDKTANLLGTGDSANDILSNEKFTTLKIEIAYVVGFRPTQEAMNAFVDYLRTYTFKENIEMVFLELPSPEEDDLTIQEVADLETEHRTVYNDGDTLGMYIYFADAPSDGDEEDEGLVTLGAVYRNTSMIIYEATVRKLANQSTLISTADVESATLNHEFGHLFGLVDLGTEPVNEHEDPDSDNHCSIPGCLMQAQLQFSGTRNPNVSRKSSVDVDQEIKVGCSLSGQSVLQMLNKSTNSSKGLMNTVLLDSECILDIQSNGGR